ncbi:MAG: nitrogenase, partial [Planctomycetota bacterium]|nr:nitrogenase [Planctomycetota bacterium]
NARDLHEQSRSGSLPCGERIYGQCSDCSQGCAETITYLVKNAAVVVHSPIGCCNNASNYHIQSGIVTKLRGTVPVPVRVICSNISEQETVYGGREKLREAIDEAYRRFHPAAVFVHSSCAAGIVGDDIESVADEKEDELGIPVVPVYCEGFKSKIWATGFDAAFHGILRKIVRPAEKKQPDLVNLFNFEGSDTFRPMLEKLGLRTNYVIPLADVDVIATLSEAACTAHICETLAMYAAKALEQNFGVPEVKSPPPFGLEWTDRWLREVARLTGRENVVEDVIAAEHARVLPDIEKVRAGLKGKKAYIFAGDSYAHSLANAALDIGLEVIGITTLHHDQLTDGKDNALDSLGQLVNERGNIEPFTVCNKQPFQLFKIMKKIRPDILIVRHMNMTVLGSKLGIPTILEGDVNISAGYDGIAKLGRRIEKAIRTRKILETIASHVELPYSEWWLEEEDPFYFERGRA